MTHDGIFQATPLLHVPNLADAIFRLTRVLGFDVKSQMPGFAYLECGSIAVRVIEEAGRVVPPTGAARATIYVDVEDVDALYAEMKPRLKTLPEGDVHPPIRQPWNQREFQVRLPDGNWITYGQKVESREPEPVRDEESLED